MKPDTWAEMAREYCPASTWQSRLDESQRRCLRGDPRYYACLPWALMPRHLRGELRQLEQRELLDERERHVRRRLTMPEGERGS